MYDSRRFRTLLSALVSFTLVGLAGAQTLTLTGSCPGPMTFDIANALPNSQVALITAAGAGSDLVPGGPCVGTELGVSGNLKPRSVLTADAAGQVSLSASVPEAICGSWLQAVDLGSCGPTNAEAINFAAPVSITLDCTPTLNELRLGCTVTVDPPQPIEIRYSRNDGLGIERANRGEAVSTTHDLPVVFLAPRREYSLEAIALGHPLGMMATTSVTTGSPPFDVDSGLEMMGVSAMGLVGAELPCDGDAIAVIYDTSTGDLVWYEDIDPSGTLGILDMVRFTDEQTIIGETGNGVVEVDLTGQLLAEFGTNYPGCCNLHHDIFKAAGNYYGFYQDTVAGLTLDAVVVLDPQGNELYEWDPREHLSVPPGAFGDWLHTNAIFVEEDLTATLSWLTRDSVAKIDLNPESPTFGEVLWIMDGNPPDELPSDILIDWSNVSGADSFSGQHNFHRRNDGRYMVLDNDHGRGIVFTIDEENRTATVDATYDTVENVCGAQGTAMDAKSGNGLVACSQDFLREYDVATSNLIWQGEVQCANGGGGFFGTGSARWYPLDDWSNAYLPTP